MLLLERSQIGVPGDLVFVRVPTDVVEVPGEVLTTAVQCKDSAASAGHGVAPQFDHAFESIVRRILGDAGGDRVDHSAYRAATVQQGRRPAKDLDLLGHHRIDAHRVVHARRGSIHGVEPVLHDSDARARKPANDRPGRTGGEIGRTDAELTGERFAQSAAGNPLQGLFLNDGNRLCQFVHRPLAKHARYVDFLYHMNTDFVVLVLLLCGNDTGKCQRRRCHQQMK